MKYKSLDGLRAYSAILLLIMHIKANTNYNISGVLYNAVIDNFSNLVYLFMMMSSFSMCCGYYNKIKNKELDFNEFYKKRFKRIFPFFSILVIIDVIRIHTLSSIYEGFMDLTLLFGLLPNNDITVIGVGWFLGVIFLFYIMFPFFVFMIDNRKRAWLSFLISIIINFVCVDYFFTSKFVTNTFWIKKNILFCLIFLIVGGIIFLYKDDIVKKFKNSILLLVVFMIISTVLYIIVPNNLFSTIKVIKNIVLFSSYIIFALCYNGKILSNRISKFLSDISLEIYLSHMFLFRIIEKINIDKIINNDIMRYTITCVLTIFFTIIFSLLVNKIIKIADNKISRIKYSN